MERDESAWLLSAIGSDDDGDNDEDDSGVDIQTRSNVGSAISAEEVNSDLDRLFTITPEDADEALMKFFEAVDD